MDLLRLVLARQPVDSLFKMPQLLLSRRFLDIRGQVLGFPVPPRLRDCEIAYWISRGELSFVSDNEKESSYNLAMRAIFLYHTGYFLHFFSQHKEIDFWMAMASGIPEIQAAALVSVEGNERQLHQYNDLTAIPWTPALAKVVVQLSRRETKRSIHERMSTDKLTSYLKARFFPESIYWQGPTNTGVMLAVTGGQSTVDEDRRINVPEVDLKELRTMTSQYDAIRAIYAGYLYPVLSVSRRTVRGDRGEIWTAALLHARKELIDAFSFDFANTRRHDLLTFGSVAITPAFIERARTILNDPSTMQKLPTVVWSQYWIFTGESVGKVSIDSPDAKLQVAMPYDGIEVPNWQKESLQEIVLYSPEYYISSPNVDAFYKKMMRTKAYILGRGTPNLLHGGYLPDNSAMLQLYETDSPVAVMPIAGIQNTLLYRQYLEELVA